MLIVDYLSLFYWRGYETGEAYKGHLIVQELGDFGMIITKMNSLKEK